MTYDEDYIFIDYDEEMKKAEKEDEDNDRSN